MFVSLHLPTVSVQLLIWKLIYRSFPTESVTIEVQPPQLSQKPPHSEQSQSGTPQHPRLPLEPLELDQEPPGVSWLQRKPFIQHPEDRKCPHTALSRRGSTGGLSLLIWPYRTGVPLWQLCHTTLGAALYGNAKGAQQQQEQLWNSSGTFPG